MDGLIRSVPFTQRTALNVVFPMKAPKIAGVVTSDELDNISIF